MNILVSEMDINYKYFDSLDLSGTNILHYINIDKMKVNENPLEKGDSFL